jgi:hypothetical protein
MTAHLRKLLSLPLWCMIGLWLTAAAPAAVISYGGWELTEYAESFTFAVGQVGMSPVPQPQQDPANGSPLINDHQDSGTHWRSVSNIPQETLSEVIGTRAEGFGSVSTIT